ncbi:MAG: hypothetical protein OXI53_12285 [Nitrospira sp.]|nr:hypothetical protein [Nitrospira sp.]MDE0487543.1 hypothetical protein [Nitrospira sp.]
MTTATLGLIVGWIVVLGFAATILITLLALVGRLPEVKEKYLGKLFTLVVVELVGAGFWLFNQTIQPPEPPEVAFQPPLPAEVYVFGRDGEPVPRTAMKLGDVQERTFNDTPQITFDAPRKLELASNGEHLLIKSQRADHQLGTIRVDHLSDEIIEKVTSIDRHVALGQYYAECLDFPTCKTRKNPTQAIFHLTWVLRAEQANPIQQKSAAISLFHLQHDVYSCETFLLLVDKIKQYRPRVNRYAEIGDVYQTMCKSSHLTFGECKIIYLQSLKYLLRFLSLPSVNAGTDLFERVIRQSFDLAHHLTWANFEPPELNTLVDEVAGRLSVPLDAQKAQPLPVGLKNRLGEISDDLPETFQCPSTST